jgi:hypothetical protein
MVNRDRGDAEMIAKVVHCNGYSLAEDPRIPRAHTIRDVQVDDFGA